MKPITHLYIGFWRPDILTQIQSTGGKCAGLCDYVGYSREFICSLADVTCEACRHNFLEGLPNGSGTKITWDDYVKIDRAAASNRRTLKERAAELDKADWQTTPTPSDPPLPSWDGWNTDRGWQTGPVPKKDDGWSTS